MKTSILQNYRGNKNIPGVYQWIINRIPVHKKYYEVFAGSAAIRERLHSAAATVINDIDPLVVDALRKKLPGTFSITNENALQLLASVLPGDADTFIYCDPPYILSTRGSQRKIYDYEMSDRDHEMFLLLVRTANSNCMISHYECKLYDDLLHWWSKEKFKVSYRGKVVEECIYYNYEKPQALQDYSYVGSDSWDRQRVTRKVNRLISKLEKLPALERNTILARVYDPMKLKTSVKTIPDIQPSIIETHYV